MVGKPRIESVERRLKELNPRLEIEAWNSNVTEDNAVEMMKDVDLIIDCAPLFEERYLMNREAVKNNIPLVECAMFEMQAQITTIIQERLPAWPVFIRKIRLDGSVAFPFWCSVRYSGVAWRVEAVKVLSGLGDTLKSKLLSFDLRDMTFLKVL